MVIVNLPPNCSFAQWRTEARMLVQRNTPPDHLEWYCASSEPDLFANTPSMPSGTENPNHSDDSALVEEPIRVSAEFVRQCKLAICHSSDEKYALLYRILWRLTHGEPHLLDMAMDADVKMLGLFCKAVRRDIHKMTAFVRFDCVADCEYVGMNPVTAHTANPTGESAMEPLYFAWFEPEHNILFKAGEFFRKRFANTCWTIATPIGSIHWDKVQLQIDHSPVLNKPDVQDGVVALWDTYYASIFNPGRMKLKAMNAEMPRKYWRNMPETQQISALTAGAHSRVQTMLAAEPSTPPRWAKKAMARPGAQEPD